MSLFSPAQAVDGACSITGLSDFGEADWRIGLERNAAAFAKIPLSRAGADRVNAMLVGELAKRLRIEDWYRRNAGRNVPPVEAPLLVCGLPRTGTTATVAMLGLDPRFRFVRRWETKEPTPPPVAGREASDPRRLAEVDTAHEYTLGALHISDPDGPDEDLLLLAGLNMRSFHGSYPMPDDYIAWWIEDDFRSTYAYHERVLRLLHSERPPHRWLLKSPPHIFKLEAFAARYPDARFVWTHRDPAHVVPSNASLYQALFPLRGVDPIFPKSWTGQRCLSFWADGARRALAARERLGEHRFIDIYNTDLVRDPIGAFQALYEKLGFVFTPEFKVSLERFHAKNARGSHGAHEYTLEEYGLTREQVRAEFKDYIDRFGV